MFACETIWHKPASPGANTMTAIAMNHAQQITSTVEATEPVVRPPSEPSDAQLMARLARGEMNALGQLVRRHQDHVRDLAGRITRHWDLADDITQETFLRVLRSAPRYAPDAAFTTWLYRIVVNLCLDAARRPKLVALADPDPPVAEQSASDPPIEREERCHAVTEAVDSLPERQRIALILHRFREMPLAEIARVTGWTASAVESLLVRAYATLRDRLKDWRTS